MTSGTSLPRIGQPVRGSKTGRPIMVVLDLLGRRGALRMLYELRGEPLKFRALLEATNSNPAALNTRLRELREAGIVEHDSGGYRLTDSGRELAKAMMPLVRWADRWAGRETS